METVRRSWRLGVREEGEVNRQHTKDFKAVKILCRILYWWVRIIIHLPKPTECATPIVKPDVCCGPGDDGVSVRVHPLKDRYHLVGADNMITWGAMHE